MRKLLLVAGCWLFVINSSFGQVNGDFRTIGNVTFAAASNWERYNGSAWVAAGAAPLQGDNIITIRTGNTATITANKTLDQVIVASGGVLTINSGQTLTIANGAGTDLNVSGTINNSGTITPTGTIVFNASSAYNHTQDGGSVPNAAWDVSSTCNITGVTGTEPAGGLSQSFGNFTWNCTGQTGIELNINPLSISFGGAVTGDFTLASTGTGSVRLANITPRVLDIAGDFNISGGTFIVAILTGSGTVNIGGDFNMTGGTITETGSSSGLFIFDNGGTTQNFRRTVGTISSNIGFTVNSNVTIDFGTSDYVNGSGTFTLSIGATLQTANPLGVNGSIQFSSRSLSTSANYTFDGTAAQVTGTYLPLTVNNFTINNVSGITLTNGVTAAGTLFMNSGNINTGANTFTLTNPLSSALNYTAGIIVGRFERFINTTSTNYFFPVGIAGQIQSLTANFINLTSGSLLVRYINGDPGNSGLPLNDVDGSQITNQFTSGYWSVLAKNSLSSANYNIELNATGFGPYTINAGTRLIKRTDTGGSWVLNGTHSDAAGSVVKRNGMSGIYNTGAGTQFSIGRSVPKITIQPLNQAVCENAGTVFSVTASGYPTLSYQWYKEPVIPLIEGGRFTGTNLSSVNISNVTSGDAGNYYCIVTDGNGSTLQSTSAMLTVNALPVATASNTGPVCVGSALSLIGAPAGMTSYSWSGPGGFTSTYQSPAVSTNATAAMAGLYTFTVTNASGCINTVTSAVIVNSLPLVNITSSNSMCLNDLRTLTGSPAGGTFTISDGPGIITGNVLLAIGTGIINIDYNYTNICTNKATQSIIVNEIPNAIAGPDQELNFVFETRMNAVLSSSEMGKWSLISGSGQFSDTLSPTTLVTDISIGENVFLWTVRNGNCETSSEVKITVNDLFVPSVITPDGDGKNDYFKIIENIGKVELIIFNRWGNEEYSSSNYLNDWDGRNNKGMELTNDTYFYILIFENGKIKKGSVLIKR